MLAEVAVRSNQLINDRLWRLEVEGRQRVNRRAVVFVHGFTGTAEDTWKTEGAQSFPQLLARDTQLQDHDIFLFQYATGFFFPPDIKNIVNQFEFALDQHLANYSILFITHSMGGLVCMSYVLRQLERAAAHRAIGLLTYGTPMSGVEWSNYASVALRLAAVKIPVLSAVAGLFKKNRQLENLRAGGEFIDQLTSRWVLHVLNGGYPSIPAAQRTWLPTRVVTGNDDWVVKESSARGFYGDIDWIPVQKGHIAMIKPAGEGDESYQIARDFIRHCRGWIGPASARRLREQADVIWGLHNSRRIAGWNFDWIMRGREAAPGGTFGLPGFGVFEVRMCSYQRMLEGPTLRFGFAFGTIASDGLWNDQFVFLHRITLRGVSREESNQIVESLRSLLSNPSDAWARIFEGVSVTVGTGADAVPLLAGPPVVVDDGLVVDFRVPPELIGTEDRVNISFRSLVPLGIYQYKIWFPWLCEGFKATASFDRGLAFLAAAQAMRGSVEADHEEETFGKIRFESPDLVLPGSYILIEWRYSDEDHGKTTPSVQAGNPAIAG